MDRNSPEAINAQAYDRMAKLAHPLAQPVREDELKNPLAVVDEIGWLGGDIRGWRVLALAAGGGRHSALYSAAVASLPSSIKALECWNWIAVWQNNTGSRSASFKPT